MRISDWSSDVCSSDLVVGDFDCDGATACAVAVRGLRMLGARRVSHAVPNRMVHGYGLSPALVEELAPLQPDLLVTVDHGIACHAGIAAAKAHAWQVLVTDHHLPGDALPPRSEEHTSELQSLMRISYAVFCLKTKKT